MQLVLKHAVSQRRLHPGMETPEGFFQVRSQKEYQNLVIISFVHLEKTKHFFFYVQIGAKQTAHKALYEVK